MKYLKIYILSISLFVLGSCGEGFLDLTPAQSLSTGEALETIEGFETALFGAYDDLQTVAYYGRNMFVLPEIEADLVYLTISNSNRFVANYTYNWIPTDGTFTGLWNRAYRTILRVNNIINNIDGVEGDDATKNQLKGEALAIRALAHFDLVRWFAKQPTAGNPGSDLGVPIVLESIIDEPSRNTVSEVYTQIVSDLNAAKGLMSSTDMFRFNANAVDAFLARVHLYNGDYSAAESAASAVIGSGSYALADNYATMFAAPGSSEEIFTLRVIPPDEDNGSDNLGGIYNPQIYGDIRVASDLIGKYEEGDTRANLIYMFDNGEFYTSKFFEQDGVNGLHSPKIFRLGELYLIRAEARMQTGNSSGALDDVNAIREKRGASPLGSVDMAEILDERARELAFEGHRLFDMVRTGTTIVREQCNTGIELTNPCTLEATSFLTVHPIPQREMDVNQNMVQNDGYE